MYEVVDLHSQRGFPTNDAQLTTSYSFFEDAPFVLAEEVVAGSSCRGEALIEIGLICSCDLAGTSTMRVGVQIANNEARVVTKGRCRESV
jgi:hypothetical protein